MDFDSTNLALENHRLKEQLAAFVVLQEQNAKLKVTLEVGRVEMTLSDTVHGVFSPTS